MKSMTKTEKRVHEVVKDICKKTDDKSEVVRRSCIVLDKKYNINCADDGSKAGDYLTEAIAEYFSIYTENN